MKGSKIGAALVLRERGPDLNLQPPAPRSGLFYLHSLVAARRWRKGVAILDCCGEVTSALGAPLAIRQSYRTPKARGTDLMP